jgi:hypothetical protein
MTLLGPMIVCRRVSSLDEHTTPLPFVTGITAPVRPIGATSVIVTAPECGG